MRKLKNFLLIIIIVSLLLVASTLGAWYISKSLAKKETTRLFNDEVNVIESWISNRFEFYKTITYSFQAFWASSEVVTKEEWQTYAETLKINERFPGIASISFVKRVDNNYLVTFVYPPERETAIGVNVITQPGHLEVINKAIETASPAITDKVFLLADQKPGFVMYTPLYKTGFLKAWLPLALDQNKSLRTYLTPTTLSPTLTLSFTKARSWKKTIFCMTTITATIFPKANPEKDWKPKEQSFLMEKLQPSWPPQNLLLV